MAYGCSIWRVECGMWDKSIAEPHPTLTRDSAAWSRGVSQCQCASVPVLCVSPVCVYPERGGRLTVWLVTLRERESHSHRLHPTSGSQWEQPVQTLTHGGEWRDVRQEEEIRGGGRVLYPRPGGQELPARSVLSVITVTYFYIPASWGTAAQQLYSKSTCRIDCHLTLDLSLD